jgi:type I restriction-modification system DNA methylase subunit
MALFQQSVIKKHIESLDSKTIDQKWQIFTSIFHNSIKQSNIRNSKEEQFQEGFLRELFVGVFGYTINPDENFNLLTELKNINNSKKADGAILVDGKAIAVIELKGTETTDLSKIETQAFGYKNNQSGCNYVVTSNFEKLRFYIDNTTQVEEFNLFTLNKDRFQLLYACLAWDSIRQNTPIQLLNESVSKEKTITNKLYNDYSEFKRALFANMVDLNPQFDKLELFKKSQKLLDRFLFIFFAEDRLLLPTNLIFRINAEWDNLVSARVPVSLYDRYKMYFNDLNQGAKVTLPAFGKKTGEAITAEFEIFAYNGGLFQPDEILDSIKIDDALLYNYTQKMSDYNFESDVDVNILGHIFENSLNEIDEVKSEIEGTVLEKTKTRRKKDGVFYTPKYITKYIVDNTIGKLCTDKKGEIKLLDEEYITDKKLQTKTKKALLDKLAEYRSWLLDLTICDPACGSGAFLNQALEFLIAEHQYIDELQAKLMGDALILSDIENSILEKNIYGVDLNDESVEIAKLSLWLRTAQKGRKLNSLTNNIKCGNSLIDDPVIAGEKAFSWEKEFPDVFSKGGFDIVIGNPPYVRQELLGNIQKDFFSIKYPNVYNGLADLYVYFYDLSLSKVKEEGLLGFITPNKWMERKYGFELRKHLINYHIIQIINFGELRIFEDASTEPEITIIQHHKKVNHEIEYAIIKSLKEAQNTPYVLNRFNKSKLESSIWRFNNKNVSEILEKFKNVNSNLNKYTNGGVYYGVKTGLNEAFIIDQKTRNDLCKGDDKSNLIIKKMVEGDDFKKWTLNHSGRYMITTFPSKKIDIDNYKAIKTYLSNFGTRLDQSGLKGARKKSVNKWFETQDTISYFQELENPKLIYYHTAVNHSFYYDTEGYQISANCYFISNADRYLQCILNSSLFGYVKKFMFPSFGDSENGGRVRLDANKMVQLPIKDIDEDLKVKFTAIAEEISQKSRTFADTKLKFSNYFSNQYHLEKLSGKLEKWYELEFVDFIKELNKAIKIAKGVPLSKKNEFDWIDLFEENKQKAQAIKSEIDKTDKEIDQMVYTLYELTEEEIKIVEGI